ncbi:MAG: hypothetical protein WBA10_08640, partial [Elainellaceae cyanobacterium]
MSAKLWYQKTPHHTILEGSKLVRWNTDPLDIPRLLPICLSPPDAVRFDIITLFPDFFASPLESGLVGRALARGIAETHIT